MKILKQILLGLFLLILLLYVFISWNLSNRILYPKSSMALTESRIEQYWQGTSLPELTAMLPTPEPFSFQSFDDITIKGNYYSKNDTAPCVLILSHGWTSNWAGMLKYIPVLEDCACDFILYDLRAHGESEGDFPTGSIKEAKDLLALTEWVKDNKGFESNQIGWLGASWGAATSLKAGADKKNVALIMVDSPFENWYAAIFDRAVVEYGTVVNFLSYGVMQMVNWRAGINYKDTNLVAAAAQIEEPVLLIHSQTDSETYSSHSVNIAKNFQSDKLTFHHTDWGGDHTKDVLINTEKFKKVINDFLLKTNPSFLK